MKACIICGAHVDNELSSEGLMKGETEGCEVVYCKKCMKEMKGEKSR